MEKKKNKAIQLKLRLHALCLSAKKVLCTILMAYFRHAPTYICNMLLKKVDLR